MQVKNKMPAPVQITAEQLLREAKERELELVPAVSINPFLYIEILIIQLEARADNINKMCKSLKY